VRIAGADRFATADAALAAEFPTAGSAGAVVLATAANYPDALIGTALAAAKNAPLLFVDGSLTAGTTADIVKVLPPGGTVYLLGGTAAIPDSVSTALKALGFVVTRYAGSDRYGTALAVAAGLGNPSSVFLATGTNFPDALTAGPAAAHLHGAVLLTDGSTMPASVKAYLTAHPGTVYAVGAPAAAADKSAIALTGSDRYATAVAVDTSVFAGGPANIGIASGVQFPDALSGGVYQAHFGGAMVLSDPAALPTSTSTYLTSVKSTVTRTAIFGGSAALSVSVQTAIGAALGF
jgi:putative cell wall-binding protein